MFKTFDKEIDLPEGKNNSDETFPFSSIKTTLSSRCKKHLSLLI
jgi:hypothetical protein